MNPRKKTQPQNKLWQDYDKTSVGQALILTSSADVHIYIYIVYTIIIYILYITYCIHRCSPLPGQSAHWPFHGPSMTAGVAKRVGSWETELLLKTDGWPVSIAEFARRLPLKKTILAVTSAEVHKKLLSKVDLWGGKCRHRESSTWDPKLVSKRERKAWKTGPLRWSDFRDFSRNTGLSKLGFGRWKTRRSRQTSYKQMLQYMYKYTMLLYTIDIL